MTVISCPSCKTKYPFRPEYAGRMERCKTCSYEFRYPFHPDIASSAQPITLSARSHTGDSPFAQGVIPCQLQDGVPFEEIVYERGMPYDHVPEKYGKPVLQWTYQHRREKVYKAVLFSICIMLFMCFGVCCGLLGSQNIWFAVPMVTLSCVGIVILFGLLMQAIKMLMFDKRFPRILAVTTKGVYFPAVANSWRMVFIPFHSQVLWNRRHVSVKYGSFHYLEAHAEKRVWYISADMLPSLDDYGRLLVTLEEGLQGKMR